MGGKSWSEPGVGYDSMGGVCGARFRVYSGPGLALQRLKRLNRCGPILLTDLRESEMILVRPLYITPNLQPGVRWRRAQGAQPEEEEEGGNHGSREGNSRMPVGLS